MVCFRLHKPTLSVTCTHICENVASDLRIMSEARASKMRGAAAVTGCPLRFPEHFHPDLPKHLKDVRECACVRA